MYNYLFLFPLIFSTNILFSQEVLKEEKKTKEEIPDSLKLWNTGGEFNFYTSQLGLSNWASGGQSSISGTVSFSMSADYKKEKTEFENSLDLNYGLIKQNGSSFSKSDDKIDFSSKYEHEAHKDWYYSLSLNFKTQFAPGYKLPNDSTKISGFLAPAYIISTLGYNYKPNNKFALLFAPLTSKITIVGDQVLANAGTFGVEKALFDSNGDIIQKGKNIRSEFGGAIIVVYKGKLAKNVNLNTKLGLFSNYLNNPENIDVTWDMLIKMNVNKHLAVSIATNLIYDDDIKIAQDTNNDNITDKVGPTVQFKEVLGIGFTFKF